MKAWNWKRIGCVIAGGLLVGAAHVFPALEFLTGPGYALLGVAVKTPGHAPLARNPTEEVTEVLTRSKS